VKGAPGRLFFYKDHLMPTNVGTIFHMNLSEIAQCSTFAEWVRRFGSRRAVSATPKPNPDQAANEKKLAALRATQERLLRENEELKKKLRLRAANNGFSAMTAAGDHGKRPRSRAGLANRLRFGGFRVFGDQRS
jgi:hypothetical protein